MARDTHLHFSGVYIPRYCVEDMLIVDNTADYNSSEVCQAKIFSRGAQLCTHVTTLKHADFRGNITVFEPVDEVFAKVQAFLNQPE
jgi:hypothetical protein